MTKNPLPDELIDAEHIIRTFTFDGADSGRARRALETLMSALRASQPASSQARIRELERQVAEARDSLALADQMLSEHIEKFHDFDYEPHQIPPELTDLRAIEHHLIVSLILDDDIAAMAQASKGPTIDDIPSCGQENDYRRAQSSAGSASPEDINRQARELLALEYERLGVGDHGNYPTYAELARKGNGAFTLCSIRAVEAALRLNGVAQGWRDISTAPNDGDQYPIQICGGGFRGTSIAWWSGEIQDATHWAPMLFPISSTEHKK